MTLSVSLCRILILYIDTYAGRNSVVTTELGHNNPFSRNNKHNLLNKAGSEDYHSNVRHFCTCVISNQLL